MSSYSSGVQKAWTSQAGAGTPEFGVYLACASVRVLFSAGSVPSKTARRLTVRSFDIALDYASVK